MGIQVRSPNKIKEEDINRIAKLKVHPGIGFARVGNSPTEYFIGPEVPGIRVRPEGGYKDRGEPDKMVLPRVKRQGVRFRIFAYDEE